MRCLKIGLGCGMAVAASVVFSSPVFAAEPTKPANDAAKDAGKSAEETLKKAMNDQMDAAMAEAMKKWEAYSTPGEHHKHLEQWAGEWDLATKHWMVPGAPPEESKATSSAKMAMGGRYLIEKVKGEFDMGGGQMTPFEGMAFMGYDNHKKQYFSVWVDSFGTGMMEEWGTCDGTGKVLKTEGKTFDPMIGAERATKSTATIVDTDTRKLEMYAPGPDGKFFLQMEIVYKRKK